MAKEAESEKITINLGFVDLGQIDLLVEDGFYSNRTDFIRTAIRNQLSTHGEVVKKSVERREMVLGLQRYSRRDLEKVLASGEQLADPGAGPRHDRRRRHPAARPAGDCLHRGARRPARQSRGEGGARRSHPLVFQPKEIEWQ